LIGIYRRLCGAKSRRNTAVFEQIFYFGAPVPTIFTDQGKIGRAIVDCNTPSFIWIGLGYCVVSERQRKPDVTVFSTPTCGGGIYRRRDKTECGHTTTNFPYPTRVKDVSIFKRLIGEIAFTISDV